MTPGTSNIEERLEAFASRGKTNGFTLRIWSSKAKALEKQGIILRNPKPTGRIGEAEYEIDFSIPMPGTFSEYLYEIAMRKNISESVQAIGDVTPLPHPYNQD